MSGKSELSKIAFTALIIYSTVGTFWVLDIEMLSHAFHLTRRCAFNPQKHTYISTMI